MSCTTYRRMGKHMRSKDNPVVISALLDILESRGVITKDDCLKIKDIASLSIILEGKLQGIMDKDEKAYLSRIKVIMKNKSVTRHVWDSIIPPSSLDRYHSIVEGLLNISGDDDDDYDD